MLYNVLSKKIVFMCGTVREVVRFGLPLCITMLFDAMPWVVVCSAGEMVRAIEVEMQ